MKISILLPYKENYSPEYPGAVSLFISSTNKISVYKKDITVFGNTQYKKKFSNNYINIPLNKNFLFKSQSKEYVNKFIDLHKNKNIDIVEIHNRPNYVNLIRKLNAKIVLYFHNDPLSMIGSKKKNERENLLITCEKIIFNSEWSKKRFLKNLENIYYKSTKLEVIHQSINREKVDLNKKLKLITFVGKLNSAKGYDLFGESIIKILDKHKNWRAIVVGDEPREKLNFKHKNLKNLGFQNHKKVLEIFKKTSIAVACSRWEEPFGRTSLEASSRGCAVIISNRGGLPETITNGIIIRNLNIQNLYKSINELVENSKKRKDLQYRSLKNFYLTDDYIVKKIDKYRFGLINNSQKNNIINKPISKLKILHVTNFNERHNGRLFYNTGKRINNGLIRLGHSVLEFSDRDIVSYYRSLNDINGSKKLNKKFIEVISNYVPNIIILGHADLIKLDTLKFIKKNYPHIKIVQWFLDRMDSKWLFNRKRFLDKIDIMDTNFCTTDPKSLNLPNDKEIYYMPNPVDEAFEILHNYKYTNFNNDVFFAMSHGVHRGVLKSGKFDERENFINKLLKKLPNTKFDLYGLNGKQPVWADNFINSISQSKIGLNLSQGKPAKYYSSDRFAQIIGNGLLVMVDEKTKFNNFLNRDEIVFYKDINDLSSKIEKYSHDDKLRKKIAKKGRDKYFKFFNSTIIADFIISKTFSIKKKRFYWE
ncbi:glycosyltransferase [Candidatus Pelagibacter sp. Uisw_134_02]|uniref:glycosyltransferase n=1 Tax=Candidatus Pelagibacter sp. Uisw_134_02 TaxID=3230990 RepID=UPI0039EA2A48